MDLVELQSVHQGSSAVKALTEDHVGQVRLRYEAFFGQTRGLLDGSWAWEDTTAGYVLLNSLTQREEVSGIARFLIEDFAEPRLMSNSSLRRAYARPNSSRSKAATSSSTATSPTSRFDSARAAGKGAAWSSDA